MGLRPQSCRNYPESSAFLLGIANLIECQLAVAGRRFYHQEWSYTEDPQCLTVFFEPLDLALPEAYLHRDFFFFT